ncbi:MAG: TraC family protein [Trichlorobacter sp.]|nr:TraC family protein [Trichlorobacter sp.]
MLSKVLSFVSKVFGMSEYLGATSNEMSDLFYNAPLSKYLPWHNYDEKSGVYTNQDDSKSMMWECLPLAFSSEKTLKTAEALFRLPLPKHSVMQFILHADPNIKPNLRAFEAARANNNPLIGAATKRAIAHLIKSAADGGNLGIPIRNYRLFVTLKVPANGKINWSDTGLAAEQILESMNLCPLVFEPPMLIEWMRRMFNGAVPEQILNTGHEHASRYLIDTPINKQVLYAETEFEKHPDHIKLGDNYWYCMTPKSYPSNVDPLQTSELFGGVWGASSDNSQIRTPFLHTLNVVFDDLKTSLRTKTDLALSQGAFGSFARQLARKQEEYIWAVDKMEQGEVFCHVMPVTWFYDTDRQKALEARAKSRYVWETAGYHMQEEKRASVFLFLSSLPLGMTSSANNINIMDRSTIAPAESIINILPIQADFAGSNEHVFLLQGRKGQIVPMSIFSKRADNYNGLIAASSGKGKSFYMNFISYNHLSTGVKLRVVDLGGSYKKLCNIFDGRYIDFDKKLGIEICLNPFTNVRDIEEDSAAISAIILQMVYAASDTPQPTKEENTLAQDAVLWTIQNYGSEGSVNNVFEYLTTYPKYASKATTDHIVETAHRMAFSMHNFTSEGQYGRYFVGPSTLDISGEQLVVLELDALRSTKDLFKVVILAILDAAQRELYLGDRSQPTQIIFDEAWQFLDGSNKMIVDIIESGYRRARKYFGSFFIIVQSLLDLKKFGALGEIIWANADFKFLLESDAFTKAQSENIIDYDPFALEIMKTVKTNAPKYSEVFCSTPYGDGVVRLSADNFNYFIFTSHPKENSEMEAMVASGFTWEQAIEEMIRKYRGG